MDRSQLSRQIDPTEKFLGRAHAKFILFGEHAVVYGARAVSCGIPDGATAWLNQTGTESQLRLTPLDGNRVQFAANPNGEPIERAFSEILRVTQVEQPVRVDVQLEVPTGAGLGSSAALAVAAARSIRHAFDVDPQSVVDAVAASEKIFHDTPSGIDETTALRGGLLTYQIGVGTHPVQPQATTEWVILQAAEGASTAKMVRGVRERRKITNAAFEHIILSMEEISGAAIPAVKTGDTSLLTTLVQMAHGALVALGVSTPEIELARSFAENNGALATKITGAGGGGCIIGLMPNRQVSEDLVRLWKANGKWAKAVTIHGD